MLAVLGTDQQFLDAKHRETPARHRGKDSEREEVVVVEKEREEDREHVTSTNKVRVPSFSADSCPRLARAPEKVWRATLLPARARERKGGSGRETERKRER